MCFTALFTAEFALRLYACESVAEFATNGFNIIDFLAVFPGYLSLLGVMLRQDTHQKHSFAHIGQAAPCFLLHATSSCDYSCGDELPAACKLYMVSGCTSSHAMLKYYLALDSSCAVLTRTF
ncbi:Hcn1 [Symbiodinium sp. CCMP2592]|nr:Hcn1 [Symbiodinium sp. CCMP2592]